MIKAVIFDLDGTLVRTEELKALSYFQGATDVKNDVTEESVTTAYKQVVGLSREEVSRHLVRVLDLEGPARAQMHSLQVDEPWKVLGLKHLANYERMIETPGLLEKYKCPYNTAFLEFVKREGFRVGLATLSHRPETYRILDILRLRALFDVIATREDVEKGKPDPGIYLFVAARLGVTPPECLVIEDSVNGIRSALAAGMGCVAVTSSFTRPSVHESGLLEKQWIVDDHAMLMTVARQFIAEKRLADLTARQSFSGMRRIPASR